MFARIAVFFVVLVTIVNAAPIITSTPYLFSTVCLAYTIVSHEPRCGTCGIVGHRS